VRLIKINGWVSEGGKKLGIATPINDMIVDITRKIHNGDANPSKELVEECIRTIRDKL